MGYYFPLIAGGSEVNGRRVKGTRGKAGRGLKGGIGRGLEGR